MIDYEHLKYRAKHYLEGDETKIENYQLAMADKTQTWVCHHRRELEPDRKTIVELIELGLYWNQPPEALIFLTSHDHAILHMTGENNPMYGKSSWKGDEAKLADRKRRYSASMKGKNAGKRMWYHPKTFKTVFTHSCPKGYLPGNGTRKKNKML